VVEKVSVDEAYLDFSASCQADSADASLHRALPLGRRIKELIRSERQLTASIGIAANKLLAKLASDHQKPDGLTLIEEARKVAFLRPLPVRVLHGVGHVTEQQLNKIGIATVADLQDYAGDLRPVVGSFAHLLKQYAFGIDDRPLDLSTDVKSISSENTFLEDTADRRILRRTLREQAGEIAADLQRNRLAARTVEVRVRYGDFTTLNRQMTFEDPIADAQAIYRFACHLLARHRLVDRPLRLIGLGVSHLVPPGQQLLLPLS
jgi:DNA polymerase-4